MRTKEELEKARLPKVQMKKAPYSMVSGNPNEDFNQGDLIPSQTAGETYEQQMLEVLLDIRELLTN